MADSHAHDPNAAPMHQEIVENFGAVHMWICALAGSAAIVAGLVFGLLLIND